MSGGIGYVVVIYEPGETIPVDLSSTVLHPDLADACFERDLRTDEAREAGRRERYVVCEVAEPEEEDQ